MTAKELISYLVPPLKPSDTGEKALNWMSDFHVRHLPMVEDGNFIGLLSEDELLNLPNDWAALEECQPHYLQAATGPDQHLYDVMKWMVDLNLTAVPVIGEDRKYLGLITLESLMEKLATTGSISHPGGVLVLEMDARDYSMAEIARLVESEKATILSSFVSSAPNAKNVELTLKLNRQDLKHVAATFERFGYHLKGSFYESEYLDALQDRYDAFMRYLDM